MGVPGREKEDSNKSPLPLRLGRAMGWLNDDSNDWERNIVDGRSTCCRRPLLLLLVVVVVLEEKEKSRVEDVEEVEDAREDVRLLGSA